MWTLNIESGVSYFIGGINISQQYFGPGFNILRGSKYYCGIIRICGGQFLWYSSVAFPHLLTSMTKTNFEKVSFLTETEKLAHPRNYIPQKKQKTSNLEKMAPTSLNDSTVYDSGILLSICLSKLCTLSTCSPEPLGQFQQNLAM